MRLDGASSQNLRFWGLGSGLDVDDIVSKLIQADRQPLERLQQQRQLLLWQQEEYRALNLKMRELSDAALAIRLQVNFASMTAHSSHGDVIGVSALPAAPSATYTLSVEQLADSLHLFSKSVTAGATLAEWFEGLDETVSFRIERLDEDGNVVAEHGFVFSAETDSLHDVVKRINALSEELDLEAFYDADLGRFFLSGRSTGSQTGYRLVDTEGNLLSEHLQLHYNDETGTLRQATGEDVIVRGRDAVFTLNGASGLRAAGNTVTINGVSFTFKQVTGQPVTVRVEHDIDRAVRTVKEFVERYNDLLTALQEKLTERREYKYPPLTESQKEELTDKEIDEWQKKARSGLLRSDPLLTRLVNELRSALTSPVEGRESFGMLFEIGITTGPWYEGGKLHVDEDKLRAALAKDPAGVAALFTHEGDDSNSSGVGMRFAEALNSAMEALRNRAGIPNTPVDNSPLGRQIKLLNDRIEATQERLKQREAAYYARFVALEQLIGQANVQSLWLAQQFGGWS